MHIDCPENVLIVCNVMWLYAALTHTDRMHALCTAELGLRFTRNRCWCKNARCNKTITCESSSQQQRGHACFTQVKLKNHTDGSATIKIRRGCTTDCQTYSNSQSVQQCCNSTLCNAGQLNISLSNHTILSVERLPANFGITHEPYNWSDADLKKIFDIETLPPGTPAPTTGGESECASPSMSATLPCCMQTNVSGTTHIMRHTCPVVIPSSDCYDLPSPLKMTAYLVCMSTVGGPATKHTDKHTNTVYLQLVVIVWYICMHAHMPSLARDHLIINSSPVLFVSVWTAFSLPTLASATASPPSQSQTRSNTTQTDNSLALSTHPFTLLICSFVLITLYLFQNLV